MFFSVRLKLLRTILFQKTVLCLKVTKQQTDNKPINNKELSYEYVFGVISRKSDYTYARNTVDIYLGYSKNLGNLCNF